MAAALEDTTVSYEDLAAIEREFDDVETEIIRQQATLSAPIYARRTEVVSQIPNFWPLVIEQAPPDIDKYITPSDSALLLSALTSFAVSRPQLPAEPRSLRISLAFADNEHFGAAVLEKTFWYRRARDGWAGLVSEPVAIPWKEGKDLTGGILDLAVKAYASASSGGAGGKKGELSAAQKELERKIEDNAMGGVSFFAWLGYVGRRISAEENEEAVLAEKKRLEEAKNGVAAAANGDAEGDEEWDAGDVDERLEIFPDGEELALTFADDLWPGAIKYFTTAQEQDALSDLDFESDADIEDVNIEDLDEDEDERPAKKSRKA